MSTEIDEVLEAASVLGLVQYQNGVLAINGSPVVITSTVADWTALQAIPKTAANDGICIYVSALKAEFTYINSIGRWVANRQIVYMNVFGTKSVPTCTIGAGITAKTVFPHGTIKIPAYMFDANTALRVMAQVRRHGTAGGTSVTCNTYIGTDNSINTDVTCHGGPLTNNDGYTLDIAPLITFGSKTSLTSSYANPDNQGTTTNDGLIEQTTKINTDVDMYINVAMNAKDTADTFDLLFLMVEIVRS